MTVSKVRLIALSLAALLAACSDSSHKIGSTVKGTRVEVIEQVKAPQADPALAGTQPSLPPEIVNMSWAQAGYDSSHAMPYAEAPAHPQIAWKQSIGEGSSSDYKLLATPVADFGVIYTMDSQGLVSALSVKAGSILWQFDTTPQGRDDKAIGGGLAVDGGVLYVTTGFGDVIALNGSTGALKWRRNLQKPLRAAPTVVDNRVYVVSIDNQLTALQAGTGDILWHQEGVAESATLMGASSVAVMNDSVVAAYNSGDVFDLRAQNGRSSWNFSLASTAQGGAMPAIADIRALPVISKGRLYAISHSGRMAAIELRSGDRIWENDIGGIDTPVVAGDTIFLYGGDGQLMALARESGRILWTKKLDKRVDPEDKDSDAIVWAGPVLAGDRLWMVNSLGKLASFSPEGGSPMDIVDLGSPAYLPPIIVNHTIYVVTDDGTLTALR